MLPVNVHSIQGSVTRAFKDDDGERIFHLVDGGRILVRPGAERSNVHVYRFDGHGDIVDSLMLSSRNLQRTLILLAIPRPPVVKQWPLKRELGQVSLPLKGVVGRGRR